MSHKDAIDKLRTEGFGVDDNPDLMDCLHSVSPTMPRESARMQTRYWELREGKEVMLMKIQAPTG